MHPSDITNARRAYLATLSLAFADIPAVDLKDRLSLLTVASGLRKVGVLETWGQRLTQTRDILVSLGFPTSTATCVWSTIDRPVDAPHHDVLQALDERRVAGKPRHVLWIYSGSDERDRYRQARFTQQQAGTLLQYPACCIGFESGVMALLPKAQLDALVAKVGGEDDVALNAALKRTKDLPTPKFPLPNNALRTEQQLPFVLHVACDNCLANPSSPSAQLNAQYEELIRETDSDLHQLFLQVRDRYIEIGDDQAKNRDALLSIRALHAALLSRR
jgi:hypothetical protein